MSAKIHNHEQDKSTQESTRFLQFYSDERIYYAYLMYLRVGYLTERIMSIANKAFKVARNPIAAAVFAAGVSLASLGGAAAEDLASANQGQQAAALTQTFEGKPVTLRVGPGFSLSAADGIADVLNEEGCPTTVTTERGFPMHVTVETNGKKFMFTEIGSAANQASDWCLDQS